jgi:hypothetical protein
MAVPGGDPARARICGAPIVALGIATGVGNASPRRTARVRVSRPDSASGCPGAGAVSRP